jgi:VanZ family protein
MPAKFRRVYQRLTFRIYCCFKGIAMLVQQMNTLSESPSIDIATVQTKQYSHVVTTKIIFFLMLTAISVLAFSPNYNALPSIVVFSDKLNHTTAFTVLFLLLRQAYPHLSIRKIFIILITNAVWIEAVQYFLPTRSSDWKDIAADCVGMFVGYLFIYLFRRIRHTKIHPQSSELIL